MLIHNIIGQLYELPEYCYLLLILLSLGIWICLSTIFINKRIWNFINFIILLFSFITIVLSTLIFRRSQIQSLSLIPFSFLNLAKSDPDIYKEVLLNIVLFFPVGLTLPFVLFKFAKHPIIISIISSMCFSLSIEIIQYLFSYGYAEIDDVIFNTLGVVIGSVSFLVFKRFSNHHLII